MLTYSSAIKNDFLNSLVDRSERQVMFSVERTDETSKANVGTGGADAAVAFAVFSVVALGALATKKRK